MKNQKLEQIINEAEMADGYMVLVTRLVQGDKEDKLIHTTFTDNFNRDDIMPSLDEFAKLLESEIRK